MRVLLDTHTFLWYIAGDEETSHHARELITDPDTDILFSIASLWEIAIKTSIGKLDLSKPYEVIIPEQIELNSIKVLPISMADLTKVSQLPFHHRDPFDRLIIAQALNHKMSVVGVDSRFEDYDVKLIW